MKPGDKDYLATGAYLRLEKIYNEETLPKHFEMIKNKEIPETAMLPTPPPKTVTDDMIKEFKFLQGNI
jgi:hypothetical protein